MVVLAEAIGRFRTRVTTRAVAQALDADRPRQDHVQIIPHGLVPTLERGERKLQPRHPFIDPFPKPIGAKFDSVESDLADDPIGQELDGPDLDGLELANLEVDGTELSGAGHDGSET